MKLIKKKAPKFLSASFVSFALMMATPMPAYGNLSANEQNLTTAQENSSMNSSNALEDMKERLIIKETIQTTVDAIHNDYGQYITEQSEKALTTLVEESESIVDTETLQEICKHCQKILEQYKEIQKLEREAHLNEVGNNIQNAAYNTYYAKSDMCAAYVSYVFQNAGYGYLGGNANDMYYKYCNTSDRNAIRKGMIIAVASHDYSNWAGRTYGHVGVIVEENGQLYVRDNIGHINMTPIDQWIDNYNNLMEVKWGWPITV